MDVFRLREVRPASLHHVPIAIVRADAVAEMLLHAIEVERREKLAVRHRLDPICISAHADEPLDVRVPWCDVVVADRPVHPVALTLGRREFVFAPTLAGATPDD